VSDILITSKFKPLFSLLHDDQHPDVDTVIITGGRNSFKSFTVAVFTAIGLVDYGWNILYTRYTNESIADSVKPEVSEKIELLNFTNKVRDLDTRIECGENKIGFKGIHVGSKQQTAALKSLKKYNCFVNDEAEELPDYDTFKKIYYSIRSHTKRNLSILILNPCWKRNWIYKEFFLERGVKAGSNTVKDNVMYIHTSYLDGEIEYIPRNILRDYERLKLSDPAKYENIVMGGWLDDPENIVFPKVDWIKQMPDKFDHEGYGCDFGETAQTAIVQLRLKLNYAPGLKHDLYIKRLFYSPTETSREVADVMRGLGLDKVNSYIWCDNNMDNESAGEGWIIDLRNYGINAVATTKFKGSRAYWIGAIKNFNLHIVEDAAFMKEQELFKYEVVDGIQLSRTIKKHDHLWSATGYGTVGEFSQYLFL